MFLFLVRCRFLTQFSISSILRKSFGENLVKSVRKLGKLDFKHKKVQLDLEVLQACKKINVIPKFLRFKLAKRQLSSSHDYNVCQKILLNEEISNKHKLVRVLAFSISEKRLKMCFEYYRFCPFNGLCS